MTGDDALTLSGLRRSFGHTIAVAGIDLTLAAGEILCLLGPSGCGKTTTLRLIAGFDAPDAGTVCIGGRLVSGPGRHESPEQRRIGMVFQEGALFPHLTVAQNVAFGLDKGQDRTATVAECLQLVNLADYENRYPHQLSGGQQQRVALARALAPSPQLVLMDEPFSNLDQALRGQLRAEVRAILKARGATVVCVTHDQEEAMQLADRVAVMNEGMIEQIGSPRTVFDYPNNRFTAEFFGSADFLPAWQDGEYLASEAARMPWPADWPRLQFAETERNRPNGQEPNRHEPGFQVMARPDCLDIRREEPGNAVVVSEEFMGTLHRYLVALDSGQQVRVMKSHTADFPPGTRVRTFLREGHRLVPFVNGQSLVRAPSPS